MHQISFQQVYILKFVSASLKDIPSIFDGILLFVHLIHLFLILPFCLHVYSPVYYNPLPVQNFIGLILPFVIFQVFMAVKIEFVGFWVVVPCSVVVGCQRFRGLCCLHL